MTYKIFKEGAVNFADNMVRRRIIILMACLYGLDSPRLKKWFMNFSSYPYTTDILIFISDELYKKAVKRKVSEYFMDNIELLWEKIYTRYQFNREVFKGLDTRENAIYENHL